MKQPVVCCCPEVMGGTAVFYGTRVPVQTLLDYFEAGDTIDDFIEGFPSVNARASDHFPRGSEGPTDRNGLLRVLLDECVDWRIGRKLAPLEVKTARQMGWAALKNGELLAFAWAHLEYLSPSIETCLFSKPLSHSLLPSRHSAPTSRFVSCPNSARARTLRPPSPAAGRPAAAGRDIVAAPRANPSRADGLCSPNIIVRAVR